MSLTAQSLLAELDTTLIEAPASWRSAALRQIVDLFLSGAQSYGPDQVALFDAVMGRMLKSADRAQLADISKKLASLDNAPAGVIGSLARHADLGVCGPVLECAKAVADNDLVTAADKDRVSPSVLEKIAAREELGEAVTEVLLKRGTPAIQRMIVANPKARISEGGFARLLVGVGNDKSLAAAIAARSDVPDEIRMWLDRTLSE
jgi:uncharacterized protein (DUF2336 family)